MTFELKIFSHDHTLDITYTNPELLVAQETLVSDVVDLLCSSWYVSEHINRSGMLLW